MVDTSHSSNPSDVSSLFQFSMEIMKENRRLQDNLADITSKSSAYSDTLTLSNQHLIEHNKSLQEQISILKEDQRSENSSLRKELESLFEHLRFFDHQRAKLDEANEQNTQRYLKEIELLKAELANKEHEIVKTKDDMRAQAAKIDFRFRCFDEQLQLARDELLYRQRQAIFSGDHNIEAKQILSSTKAFDSTWYSKSYANLLEADEDPLDHYIREGNNLPVNPNDSFDGIKYLRENKDVAASGFNPLYHFMRFGQHEGRAYPAKDV